MVTSQVCVFKIYTEDIVSADPSSISTPVIVGVGAGVASIGMTIIGIAIILVKVKR